MSDCVHYWEIEASTRSSAKGVCLKCGEERLFTENCNPYVGFRGQITEFVQVLREQKRAEKAESGVFE
jgi:hypothetical protein